MKNENKDLNPFTVTTPEDISAKETIDLWVDVFSDFPKIKNVGHVLLQGPRGSGKSMIFRYLKTDCQRIVRKCNLKQLPFLSLYFGIRNSQFNITELIRLDQKYSSVLLNEHFMVMYMAESTFSQLSVICKGLKTEKYLDETKKYSADVIELLRRYGWTGDNPTKDSESVEDCFRQLESIFTKQFSDMIQYIRSITFKIAPYEGILCGYMDFLYPILCKLRDLSFLPKGPVYLLIDDADNLNVTQTQILNTWISTRTTSKVSIKISSQLQYKTFSTIQASTIQAPHDYSEVNIQTIYTASPKKSSYHNMVKEIIKKRIKRSFGVDIDPEMFFPEDTEQENKIREMEEYIRRNWPETGRGNRPSDDVARYARPDFIKSLGGTRKATSTYSYAGFNQLVHVSSGIIRYFLESAAQMYAEVPVNSQQEKILFIPQDIQNRIVRRQANDYLIKELGKISDDQNIGNNTRELVPKLRNLIDALGGTFQKILDSDRAERKVFSIAFSNEPSDIVRNVLKLGVELGYFHESTIGNKSGTGRTPLYILNRRLAPVYNLDPTSFAGYLFVTSEIIEQGMYNPQALLRRIENQGIDEIFEQKQLSLL
jgi:hypothetical protein